MTERTLRSLDSDLRCWFEGEDEEGMECRRDGDRDFGREAPGEEDRGGLRDAGGEDGASAHAAFVSPKNPPALGVQELLAEVMPSLLFSTSEVVEEVVSGLALVEGVLASTDRGGSILKILSSSGGGP